MARGGLRLRGRSLPSVLLIVILFLLCRSPIGPLTVHGASSVSIVEAERAYRTGLLEAAEQAYAKLLQDGGAETDTVLLRLLEIAVRRGDWAKAEAWLENGSMETSVERDFWQAQLLLGQGYRSAGLEKLEALIRDHHGHDLILEASLTLAALHLEDRQFNKVTDLLSGWKRTDDIHVDYLAARLDVEMGKHLDAINGMERLRQNPQGLELDRLFRVYFDLGRLRLAVKQPASAEAIMRTFLEQFPDSAYQRDAFELLEQAGAFSTAKRREQWLAWSKLHSAILQGDVLYQVAMVESRTGSLTSALTLIEKMDPTHPLAGEASVERARWLLASENPGGCLAFLTRALIDAVSDASVRYELEFLRATALFRVGRMAEAQETFKREGPTSETIERASAFNRVVSSINSQHEDDYRKGLDTLKLETIASTDDVVIGEALFQRALAMAKEPSPEFHARALRLLEDLAVEYPEHPRAAQAQLMRLELHLESRPPQLVKARPLIKAFHDGDVENSDAARLDYLALWYESLVGGNEKVLQLGEDFLAEHPHSPFIANVRLRRAEVFLAREDFTSAAVELTSLKEEVPADSKIKESSDFLEAFASQRLGDHATAVKLWRALIGHTEGEEQLIARHQQALTLCQQGNSTDAIAQWDEVIRSGPSVELRLRALTSKGECLTLMANADPNRGREAIAVFDEILKLPSVPVFWREQALHRKGMVHQKLGEFTEAMTAFNQVIRLFQERLGRINQGQAGPSPYWYYRSGFEAVSLLELRQQWEAAARLADELAATPGDRSEEAQQRAGEIRVRHFLW